MIDLFPLAGSTELDPNVAVPAVLTLAGVSITALFAFLASRARKSPPPPEPEGQAPPSPLAQFSGTQNEFMALVLRDNAEIRAEVAELKGEVAGLKTELEQTRSNHRGFEHAVRRYLELLAGAWPGPESMPWPDSADLSVLEQTLPRWGRGGQDKPSAPS